MGYSEGRSAFAERICACGHHAVYHDPKGSKGRVNPHVGIDYHEVAWPVDAAGGLLTDHCVGTEFTPCACIVYRPSARLDLALVKTG